MGKAKKLGWGILLLIVLFCGSFLGFYLPSTAKVTISGTEIKRFDPSKSAPGARVRDMRYILTRDLDSGEVRVFRNEDTSWGWPPYFKFDSADLAGVAVDIEKNRPGAVVLVTYYGIRSNMFSLFPNAVSLEEVDAHYTHIPIFNIVFLVLLIAVLAFLYFRWRRLKRRFKDWRRKRRGDGDTSSQQPTEV